MTNYLKREEVPYLFDDVYTVIPQLSKDEPLYGYSYKILKGTVNPRSYQYILKELNSRGDVIYNVYETDKKGRLHIHGVYRSDKPRLQFRTMIFKNVHSHFEEIWDDEGWYRYINKHQNDPYQIDNIDESESMKDLYGGDYV